MDVLLAWLPAILFLCLFLAFGYWLSRGQMNKYGEHVEEVKAINDELVQINRQVIAELREIKQILKDRS